jgi:hypothetical protein
VGGTSVGAAAAGASVAGTTTVTSTTTGGWVGAGAAGATGAVPQAVRAKIKTKNRYFFISILLFVIILTIVQHSGIGPFGLLFLDKFSPD